MRLIYLVDQGFPNSILGPPLGARFVDETQITIEKTIVCVSDRCNTKLHVVHVSVKQDKSDPPLRMTDSAAALRWSPGNIHLKDKHPSFIDSLINSSFILLMNSGFHQVD